MCNEMEKMEEEAVTAYFKDLHCQLHRKKVYLLKQYIMVHKLPHCKQEWQIYFNLVYR
jgi:hypothetical protein